MHSAPSVSYPVGRSRLARRLLLGVWALGAAGLAAWCLQFEGAAWRTAVLALAVLLAGVAARRGARLGAGVQWMTWGGQHWSCKGSPCLSAARARVHLDLQSLMLVRLHEPGGAAAWLWVERDALAPRWLDVRRALHASESTRLVSDETAVRP